MDLQLFETLPPWEWPPESSAFLHQVLTNKAAALSDREAAAAFAGVIVAMNDQIAEDLLAIIGSQSEAERLRAVSAISLGPVLDQLDVTDFDDPYEEPPITKATLNNIKNSLHRFFVDTQFPKEVRRRILEASIRSHEDWHKDAIKTAYASDDREWKLTAVFAMRFVKGFNRQILESIHNPDPEIKGEAIEAAGNWELDAAWPHIRSLLENRNTPKPLLLSAIEAAGNMWAEGALELLETFTRSKDAEIRDAAQEAMGAADFDDDDE